MIHSALHIARSDILCAAHTHSIHGKAFSTLGIELDMLTQDTCAFYDVCPPNFGPFYLLCLTNLIRTTFFIISLEVWF